MRGHRGERGVLPAEEPRHVPHDGCLPPGHVPSGPGHLRQVGEVMRPSRLSGEMPCELLAAGVVLDSLGCRRAGVRPCRGPCFKTGGGGLGKAPGSAGCIGSVRPKAARGCWRHGELRWPRAQCCATTVVLGLVRTVLQEAGATEVPPHRAPGRPSADGLAAPRRVGCGAGASEPRAAPGRGGGGVDRLARALLSEVLGQVGGALGEICGRISRKNDEK